MFHQPAWVKSATQEPRKPRCQHGVGKAVLLALAGITLACGPANASRLPAAFPRLASIPVSFAITHYDGCTGSGRTNCAGALQAAIHAAQTHGGGTVFIPPGTFLMAASPPAIIPPGPAVTILGAGASRTRFIKVASPGHPTLLRVEAPHSVVRALTFDAQTVEGGGSVVLVTTSDVTIDQVSILGGPHTGWPLRFAGGRGIASPLNPSYATGNQVNAVYLVDDPPPDDDGFDFSFQEDARITNVTEWGSRLGLYVDKNVTVSDYHFRPNPAVPADAAWGYFITAPSSHITLTDFVTTGRGGKIGPVPPGSPRPPNSDITIAAEHMLNLSDPIFLGDGHHVIITHSQLGRILVHPNDFLSGVLEDSSYAALQMPRDPQKSALPVIHCTVVP